MARVACLIVALAGALAPPGRWDAPPHTSRELQRALGDCPTADAACALLQERAHDGNEVNVAATLVRAAREGASRDTLRYLYGACRASAGRMAPRQLANAARALRLADDDETAEREAALVAVCACVAMTPPAEWTNAREVAICVEIKRDVVSVAASARWRYFPHSSRPFAEVVGQARLAGDRRFGVD